jgi:PAS domain S-box-containing protein
MASVDVNFTATLELFRTIFEQVPDAIILVNSFEHIILANAKTDSLFGYRRDELISKPVAKLLPTRHQEAHQAEIHKFMARLAVNRFMGENRNVVGLCCDGQKVHLNIQLTPLAIDNENLVLAVIRDVTESRRTEKERSKSIEALKNLTDHLIGLNEEKNRLLGFAAHDLRNPLHSIILATELLLSGLEEGHPPEDRRPLLSDILQTTLFMVNLVDGLLDLAAIESGKFRLNLAPMSAADKLADCGLIMAPLARVKGVLLEIHLPKDPIPLVIADGSKFIQILNNLLGNAIKFSRQRGRVKAWVEARNGGVSVFISDEGPGIPKEQQQRIFQPFQRGLHEPGMEGSVGLGLAIVKRIVDEHGGRIWVESQLGVGSTFEVWLPLSEKDHGPQSTPTEQTPT